VFKVLAFLVIALCVAESSDVTLHVLSSGAMVLLLEAGDPQRVLEWGQAWLSENPADKRTQDVVLAMALSFCDLAAEKLQGTSPAAMESFDFMQNALNLLKNNHVGGPLQEDIQKAMKV
jgi:hypothetical protein